MKYLKLIENFENLLYKKNDYVIIEHISGNCFGQIIDIKNTGLFPYIINFITKWSLKKNTIKRLIGNDLDIIRKMTLEEIEEYKNILLEFDIKKFNL